MVKKLPSHIYQVNGRFRVRYRKSNKIPFDFDEYYDNLEDAIEGKEQFLAKAKLNLLTPNKTKHIGFSDFCDYYLDWFKNKPKRPSKNTINGYISKINLLKILFKNQDITEINSYQIEMILAKEKNRVKYSNGAKTKDKISEHTLHHEFTMLRILFNKAYNWNFIDKNPMVGVEEPTFKEKQIIVPEYEELDIIKAKIYTCKTRERCQFLLTLFTGIREEEVCGLHIDDFNETEGYVFINRAVVFDSDKKEFVEDKTKSQTSNRKIPLPPEFFIVLKEYYVYRNSFIEYLKYKTNGTYKEIPNVFLNKDGHFYRPHRLSETWKAFAVKNDISLTFHGLRHYYLTNQMNYNENLSPRDVQELAGHSNINTTYKYVHSSEIRIKNNATNIFKKFSKDDLYKNGYDSLLIPISHIATIILGNTKISKIEDLQITLSELNNCEVDFFNISEVLEKSKSYLLDNYPALARIEKYNYINIKEDEIVNKLAIEFGNNFEIEKDITLDKSMSL